MHLATACACHTRASHTGPQAQTRLPLLRRRRLHLRTPSPKTDAPATPSPLQPRHLRRTHLPTPSPSDCCTSRQTGLRHVRLQPLHRGRQPHARVPPPHAAGRAAGAPNIVAFVPQRSWASPGDEAPQARGAVTACAADAAHGPCACRGCGVPARLLLLRRQRAVALQLPDRAARQQVVEAAQDRPHARCRSGMGGCVWTGGVRMTGVDAAEQPADGAGAQRVRDDPLRGVGAARGEEDGAEQQHGAAADDQGHGLHAGRVCVPPAARQEGGGRTRRRGRRGRTTRSGW